MIWISEKNKIPNGQTIQSIPKIRHKNKHPQNNIQISTQGASRNLKVYIFFNEDHFVQTNLGS